MFNRFYLLLLVVLSNSILAQTLNIVAVGKAKIDTISFSIQTDTKTRQRDLKKIANIIKNDFLFYKKLFTFSKIHSESELQIKLSILNFKVKSKSNVILTQLIYNDTNYQFETKFTKVRKASHLIAFNLFKYIHHYEPIFKSKIVFVSDVHTRKKNYIKELFIMDFDGYNKKQLTFFKKTVLSPAFSPDNSMVAFSLIEGFGRKKNINLYLLNLKTFKFKKVSSFKGINSGAVFSKDGKFLILTLSISGNAEIYKMNIKSKKLVRLTKNYAPDVDPSVFNDQMTFLSGRPGKPMIYTSSLSGLEKNVQRISYVGRFNATPRFSPTGKEIVFSSWLDNRFDLFRVNLNGTGLVRLTKNMGSNEDPVYSNDGQFILFSSQKIISRKKEVTNLFLIDRDGSLIGQLTHHFGHCQSPRLSN